MIDRFKGRDGKRRLLEALVMLWFEGRSVGKASIGTVAQKVSEERPDLAWHTALDGTITILFSDIEGSTAIIERLGDARWMELLREHNDIVRREKALNGGYEVKTIGDAFMLAFQSVREGLRCAIGIQRAFAKRNASAKDVIRVRIGMHKGELVKEGDDFFGRHVNFAARVASRAIWLERSLVSSLLRDERSQT
jgi:class 3 adenylate cyclase